MTAEHEIAPPPRFLLRPAGVLTQLASAFALLLGTISFILVQQNKTAGVALVIVWAAAAMAGLVFGGLMSRGGLVAVSAGALIDLALGSVLLVIDWDALRSLLRLLPEDDVAMIADILVVVAVVMLGTAVLCVASIPQARAYHRALREAEAEAEKSGFFAAATNEAMHVPVTLPRPLPPPPAMMPGHAFRGGAGSSMAHMPAMASHAAPSSPPSSMSPHAAPSSPPSSYAPPTDAPPPSLSPYAPPIDAPPAMPAPVGIPQAPYPPSQSYPDGQDARAYPESRPSQPGPYNEGRAAQRSSIPMPLPAPPLTGDGFAPAPPVEPVIPGSASTAPGWTPSPARTYTTMMIVRAPAVERRSRRRVYMMLGGFAIGLGAGVGVLVSSVQTPERGAVAMEATGATTTGSAKSSGSTTGSGSTASSTTGSGSTASSTTAITTTGSGSTPSSTPDVGSTTGTGSGSSTTGTGSGSSTTGTGSGSSTTASGTTSPAISIRAFLDTQRDLIGQADVAKLAQTFAPDAFGIGTDAEDLAEGRDALEAMLTKNLGDPPPDGFKVTSRALAIGEVPGFAWTAEDLELSGPAIATRRFAVTQLVANVDGAWTVVALCWAHPVRDEVAERLAVLGTLPRPRAMPDVTKAPAFDKAVRAAFASRRAFADARSERPDGFNFGSGPNERIVGGAKIKSLFGRLRSELRLDGGVRSAQLGSVGWAALNVAYTQKGRAATDVTQTFRVLAVLVDEGGTWQIVQTQFSNAGPITD